MAAGEYVSVHSQADTEKADLKLERAELKADNKGEHKELAAIYVARGLDPALAKQVAQQWSMTRSARMRGTNSASPKPFVLARFKPRWHRLAVLQ
jgi:VIT1/CCC1 family predicted Fe2+/Mn2+ transporter